MAPATNVPAIQGYFQNSLFLLVGAGFVTLVATGKLDAISLVLGAMALMVRGWLLVRSREVNIPESWMTWITLAAVGFYFLDLSVLSVDNPNRFVAATVHLVLLMMAVKIFSIHRDRDYLYLAVLAFLEVLAASVLTVDALFVAAFALFLLLAVNTFVSLEMRRSARSTVVCASAGISARRWSHSLFSFASVLAAGIVVIGALVFFLIPRTTAGYLSAFAPKEQLVSGFSNEVNFGKIGEIKQLDTVVMYVQFSGDPEQVNLRWRGVSLGLFDGKRWSNPAQEEAEILLRHEGRFDLAPLYDEWHDHLIASQSTRNVRRLHYRVLMEPIGESIFFLAPKPETLFGSYSEISADAGGAIFNDDREHMISNYEATSVLPEGPGREDLPLTTEVTPPGIQLRYLQLPEHLDSRVRTLAEQVTANASTVFAKASVLERYLSTSFGYTLQLPPSPPHDPVAEFLFERRQGHCEYFASAMTVMLRTLGIPARVVNGFRGGDYNPLTGSYVVRARHAHSWVEAYLPGSGWLTFDPTPSDPAVAGGSWNRLLLYLDAGREFWREWIVNYDFGHQRSLTVTTLDRGHAINESIQRWSRRWYARMLSAARHSLHPSSTNGKAIAGGLLLAACGFGLLFFRRLLQWRQRMQITRQPARAPVLAATLWYERLLRELKRRGWSKRPAQTPVDFAAHISEPRLQVAVTLFTEHYERARFAGSAADANTLPELLARLKEISSKATGQG